MKGILFKPWKIKAIAEDDREWQTRRVIKPQPRRIDNAFDGTWEWKEKGHYYDDLTLFYTLKNSSRYQVGEVVYIKEAYWVDYLWPDHPTIETRYIHYKVGHDNQPAARMVAEDITRLGLWQSPLFMPEKYARYFIKITDIRAERLQEIEKHHEDFKVEGYTPFIHTDAEGNERELSSDLIWYSELWDSINPKYLWESNPWIFVYSFKKAEK